MSELDLVRPTVENFGLYAHHDYSCPVYWDQAESAVFDCQEHVFAPSWRAQSEGWLLIHVAPGWRRWLIRKICDVYPGGEG